MALLLTFSSVHYALAAERAAKRSDENKEGNDPELVPLPPSIRSDCGFALVLPGMERSDPAVLQAIRGLGIAYEAAYRIVVPSGGDGKKEKRYERVD